MKAFGGEIIHDVTGLTAKGNGRVRAFMERHNLSTTIGGPKIEEEIDPQDSKYDKDTT